jgi:hypothetical protein
MWILRVADNLLEEILARDLLPRTSSESHAISGEKQVRREVAAFLASSFDGSIANFGPPADRVDRCQSRRAIHSKDVTTLAR